MNNSYLALYLNINMSKRQKDTKTMPIGDISKRITKSQVREQPSISAPNPPNVTNTEPIMLDGYNTTEKIFLKNIE